MHIDFVNTIEKFDSLKEEWESIYRSDQNANFFVSWSWLRGFIEITKDEWIFLALRQTDEQRYIAFLPLTIRNQKLGFYKTIHLGGSPIADYSGLVCLPEFNQRAVSRFARFLQKEISWDRFYMQDSLDPRIEDIHRRFIAFQFNVKTNGSTCCPYIPLPYSWDEYLQNCLSRQTRSKLKRRIKQIEQLNDFRIEYVNENNLDQQIETILNLWELRWQATPKYYGSIFKRCFENGNLWLTSMWIGKLPISAMAAFIDYNRKTFYVFIVAYNRDFDDYAPGRVLFAHSIKYAIENRFRFYDFLRGGERYKFSFGAVKRFNSSTIITRNGIKGKIINNSVNYLKRSRLDDGQMNLDT